MNIAIIADSKQAATLIAAGIALDEVFSFCPSASYDLRKAGYKVVSCAEYYGSLSHAKTAVIVSRQLEEITACGAECFALSASERSGFRANLIYSLSTIYYFYYATRHYKHVHATFYFSGKTYSNYEAAFTTLLDDVLRRYNHSYENTGYSTLHYHIARICNGLTWYAAGATRAVRVVHFGKSALTAIEAALAQDTQKLWIFRPRTIGKTMAQTCAITIANIKNIFSTRDVHLEYFRNTHPAEYKRNFSAQTTLFTTKLYAMGMHFPMPVFFDRVVADSSWYMPFLTAQRKVGVNIVRDLAPHVVMTNKGKYHFIRAAVEHLSPSGGVGVLINHGTHTAQAPGSISQVAANLWGSDDRIHFYNVSYVVPRLPLTVEQVKQIYAPHNIPKFIVLPTIKKVTRNYANPDDTMKIVFAGNYVGPLTHMPWCAETADEYLLNILELVEKIGAMPRVEFIIKLKARKASAHMNIIQEHIDALGYGRTIRIDTQTAFLDVLAGTHLLISNLSTTIEESLTNRVPVLLHTYRKHYFHLPCTDTGFVHRVKHGQDVRAVIDYIRLNYHRIVQNEAALDGIIWKEEEYNNLQEFTAHITQLAVH